MKKVPIPEIMASVMAECWGGETSDYLADAKEISLKLWHEKKADGTDLTAADMRDALMEYKAQKFGRYEQ